MTWYVGENSTNEAELWSIIYYVFNIRGDSAIIQVGGPYFLPNTTLYFVDSDLIVMSVPSKLSINHFIICNLI